MKLRNKSNGAILEIKLIQTNCECLVEHEVETLYGEKLSLETLNKYYEDYAPAEPLIKDEKIRKAVRAWADYNGVEEVLYITDGEGGSRLDCHTVKIYFYNEISELKDWKKYTIAELCGEEEE